MLTNIKGFDTIKKVNVNPNSVLDIEVLAIINESINEDKSNVLSFDQWIEILTEMNSDVSTIISSFSKLYTLPFLSLEIASLIVD